MSDQSTAPTPFFKPLPEHDTLNVAHLLWKMSEKVRVADSGCWEWIGAATKAGYGHLSVGNKHRLVHRIIYELCVGTVAPDLHVCHDCPEGDNPRCCNPAHLFLGTPQENTLDMVEKGRQGGKAPQGEDSPNAKLTEQDVREIRRRLASSPRPTYRGLARELGVSKTTIARIDRRKSWAHLDGKAEAS